MNKIIEYYLRLHYLNNYKKEVELKVFNVKDNGYFVSFNLTINNVIFMNEKIFKDDIEYVTKIKL